MKPPAKWAVFVFTLGIAYIGTKWSGWSDDTMCLYIIACFIMHIYWRQK